MSEDLVQRIVIEGSGDAAAVVAKVTESLEALNRQLAKTDQGLKRTFGPDSLKVLAKARTEAQAFGTDLSESAEKAAKALRVDVGAVAELRTALRGAVAEQKAFAEAVRASQAAGATSARSQAAAARRAATGQTRAAADSLRKVRQRWRLREASERAERQGIERTAKVAAASAASQAKAETAATERRLRDIGRTLRIRQRSEASELRHLRTVSRERAALRREAGRSWREAGRSAHHAVRSVNHPELSSIGFWLQAGATFGVEAGHHLLETARDIDMATTRMRMLPGVSAADAVKVREDALRESMKIGVDPAEIVKLQVQAIKDGLSPAIAKSLPEIVNAAVQTMGGSIDKDGDELAKAVRESNTVGWVKDAAGARSLMNQVSGLSTYNGNSPEKMQQFLASGGIGRGAELGWSQQQTLAFGAALNGSGERTGLGSARLMAQVTELRASMKDKYRHANLGTEEGRSVRAAPRLLGYGGIGAMSAALATPEGLSDLFTRLQRLDQNKRASIERGYGLGPQFSAVEAEMGADGGKRYKDALAREKELSGQTAANDDMSKNSNILYGSIESMMNRIRSTTIAVQSELGDVIKEDILTPFAGWWTEIGARLLDGGLHEQFHRAIMDFVRGLGFDDVAALLRDVSGHVHAVDFAGFMRGIGEGLRAVYDNLARLGSLFGGAGNVSAKTIGRVAAELFGLSVALRAVSPVLTILGGVIEALRAIGAMGNTLRALAGLAGMTGAAEGVAGAAGATAAGALLPVAIAGLTIGSLAVAVMNWREVVDGIRDVWSSLFGGDHRSEGFAAKVREHARAAVGDDLEAQKRWTIQNRRGDYDAAYGHHGRDADGISTPAADRAAALDQRRRALGLDGGAQSADKIRAALAFDQGLLSGATGDRAAKIREEIELLQRQLDEGGTLHRTAYRSGDDPNNWRSLMTPASYESSDAGDIVRDATVDTARGVVEVREAVDRLSTIMRTAALSGSDNASVAGFGGGGGEGGGNANLRYGRGASGGWRSTPGTGSYGNPSKSLLDLIAKSEGAGYNVSWGNGRFLPGGKEQNLTGKSLTEILALGDTMRRQPGARNSSALGRYQITGSTLRDLMKRMGLNGSEKFDEAMQDRLASKLISDEGPRALGRWEGLKRGNLMSQAQGLLRSGSIASQPGDVSSNGGGGGSAGGAVDIALGMADRGVGSRQASQALGHIMTAGLWCADFVNGTLAKAGVKGSGSSMANSFSNWGHHVNPGDVQKGDVIEENRGAGTRIHHAGLATGKVQRDRNGNVTAIQMVSGNYGEQVRTNWERVGIVADLRRSNEAVTAAARKVIDSTKPADIAKRVEPSKPADIAGKVHSGGRPRPGASDAPAGGMTSADNSTTHHTWHVYGEPARQAVAAALPGRSGGLTIDRDVFSA